MVATPSLQVLNAVQRLADSGRHAAVAERLGALPAAEVEQSPTLALLLGIAEARLGRHQRGQQWVERALDQARLRGDRTIQARALNVLGAIAFEAGRIGDAIEYFTRGLMEAERLSDRATVGRCSNNLGSIATLRGDYGKAVGSFTMALAAFQQAGNRAGVAETLHNMAIAYREQNDLVTARETAERAAHEARNVGDLALTATIEAGCAEIQLQDGDEDVALVSVRRALAMHRDIGDVAGESEDLRTLAAALARTGDVTEAQALLPKVISRATELDRPLLAAQAERDLAKLLHEQQRNDEAEELGRRARARFQHMGSEVEVRRLDQWLGRVSAA